MFRRTVIALSAVALLAGAGATYAQTPPPAQPTPTQRMHGMDRMKQRLGLSDDQVTAIQAAFQRHRDEQRQQWQAFRTANGELRKLALNGGDANALAAKTTEVQQLQAQMLAARVKVLQEIGPVLTPEQRAKFMEARFHGHRGHRGKPQASLEHSQS
jgi:Spy/CpxP family protein refolding chaperone